MTTYIRKGDRSATNTALWARVSGSKQDAENQLGELRGWLADLGLNVVREFVFTDSAWLDKNGKGAEFDAQREELMEGARLGHYANVATWSVDRLSRRGAEDMLRFVRQMVDEQHVKIWSYRDPWVQSLDDPFARPIILSVFATAAQFESQRRSDRVKAHIAKVKAEGGSWGGRQAGAKNRDGTISDSAKANLRAAWTPERRAALAERNRQRAASGK